ncbi:MAG: hypothetical protein DRH11_15960 [Deltaproteobacteria bacterium]|nr:MAG: hypothetical protein DRH11_15960 [Deltaproteobacteria bacterium]
MFENMSTLQQNGSNGQQEIDSYQAWFDSYVSRFDETRADFHAAIELKRVHSLNVLKEARMITAQLKLEPRLAHLIHIASLFHDLGRFVQYEKFGTFDDGKSLDHAELSAEILEKESVLAKLGSSDKMLVLHAISWHNKRKMPESMDYETGVTLKVLRDADKLDIIRLWVSNLDASSEKYEVLTLKLKPHPYYYSKEIFEDLCNKKLPLLRNAIWVNDLKLIVCSWMYDLNFHVTKKIVMGRRYLDKLADMLPKNEKFDDIIERLRDELES